MVSVFLTRDEGTTLVRLLNIHLRNDGASISLTQTERDAIEHFKNAIDYGPY